jgi:hypothetical protein
MILVDLIKALQAGQEISNPASWKKGTMLTSSLTLLVLMAFKYVAPDYAIPEGLVEQITEIVGSGLIIANIFMMKATSKKV